MNVTVAGLQGKDPIKCSRLVTILPDVSLEEVSGDSYDAVILPGGLKGSELLGESKLVGEILKTHENAGHIVAAICAGIYGSLTQT